MIQYSILINNDIAYMHAFSLFMHSGDSIAAITDAFAAKLISDDNSSIPAFSVSEFGCLDPQPHPFAANQPWQLNHFAVHPDCMLTPFPGFSPQMQHSLPACSVNCQDFGGSMVASQMRSVSALPVYAPPIHPSIIVQFLLSPDYSLL